MNEEQILNYLIGMLRTRKKRLETPAESNDIQAAMFRLEKISEVDKAIEYVEAKILSK